MCRVYPKCVLCVSSVCPMYRAFVVCIVYILHVVCVFCGCIVCILHVSCVSYVYCASCCIVFSISYCHMCIGCIYCIIRMHRLSNLFLQVLVFIPTYVLGILLSRTMGILYICVSYMVCIFHVSARRGLRRSLAMLRFSSCFTLCFCVSFVL